MFDFGMALMHLQEGRKLARYNWNGQGMFIFLVPGPTFQVNRPPLLGIYPEGTTINYNLHIDMRAVDGTINVWTASQLDILAEDWIVVS